MSENAGNARSQDFRILVIETDARTRERVRKLLVPERDLEVEAVGPNRDAMNLVRELQPEVLLLGLANDSDILTRDLLRGLSNCRDSVRTLVMIEPDEEFRIAGALKLGARGAIFKTCAAETLIQAIRTILAGKLWVEDGEVLNLAMASWLTKLAPALAGARAFGLTNRQLAIGAAILCGSSHEQIASTLQVPVENVETEVREILRKLGVHDSLELALFAVHKRLFTGTTLDA